MRVERGHALGILLSNTRITCPMVEHNPGKLGIILHRIPRLECTVFQSSGAIGWICGRLGCCWGNGPTSRSSVRVVGARARRWTLRHESRPYGAQQARKLYNAGNCDKGTPSARTRGLFRCLKHIWRKGRARPVPAAAVIPAARVVTTIIGLKASVAGLLSPLGNLTA
jgi:hypothetical protein